MIVRLVSIEEFYQHFPNPITVYSSGAFVRLNQDKAEAVRCFVGFDDHSKARLGIVMGWNGGEWRAPFSAPFADFAYRKPESLEVIYDFVSELTNMLNGNPIKITLSPPLYRVEMWNRVVGVLANYANKVVWDYNYHYPLAEMPHYRDRMSSEPRRKLKQAEAQCFEFECIDDGRRAYKLIAEHHKVKGYLMAMTMEQVLDTARVVPTDFFILTQSGIPVAAAYCQRVAEGGAQLINWGDIREYSALRPMNWMAYKLCEYYAALGFATLDFGPSSTNGIPNSPLCEFKHTIGCSLTLKPTISF